MSVNIMGKITMKYDPKKPGENYSLYSSGSDGNEYYVFLPQCNYGTDDFVQILGATHKIAKTTGNPYYVANNITTVAQNEQSPEPTPIETTPITNGQTSQPKTGDPERIAITNGLSREEGMLVIGCWTRGITSKSKEEVLNYIEYALQDYRNRNKGGDDEPFNNQF